MNYTLKIIQDTHPQSPKDMLDNGVFLVTTSNRHFEVTRKGFELDSIKDGQHNADYDVFPLYAYIHSGVVLSLGRGYPFDCQWDSGQIGYVLVSKHEGIPDTAKCAASLVEAWNQYLSGDVWGYLIENELGEFIDSCWGFYGRAYAEVEGKQALEYAMQHEANEAKKIEAMLHL